MSTTLEELAAITAAAHAAAPILARTAAATRAEWLRAIADSLDSHRDELVEIAQVETHLGDERLTGELARTTGQLRLFAAAIEEGAYLEAIIDHERLESPLPQPDLRRVLRPLGPIAMFSGSNFPFAFSVAGGDTASALAVGCPVVVKAHSGHIRLSERTARLVLEALTSKGAPEGSFAMVEGREVGTKLLKDPTIKAGSFTGSLAGGRALFDIASARPDPIPFYGELGSINPVVITAAAVAARGPELADGLASSFTLGFGQFCTKPGVVFVPRGSGFEQLIAVASADKLGGPLLTDRIAAAFPAALRTLIADAEVDVIFGTAGQPGPPAPAQPVILGTTALAVSLRSADLLKECFGPTTLIVRYSTQTELLDAIRAVGGSLTATLHSQPEDDISELVELLGACAGRLLFKGWPTGVAVTWSQNHGGPWPTTTSIFTSVGVTSMRRFQRPVVFQDAPESTLPQSLIESNPLGIPRRVDGVLTL